MSASVLILVIFSLMGMNVTGLSYSDLQAMHPSCNPKDTCATNKRNQLNYQLDWENHNCFCDHLCSEYGDCCIDSNFLRPEEENTSFDNHQCVKMKEYGNLYMKGKCMAGWQDEGIADECYNASPSPFTSKKNPMGDMPVTSKNSRITYKNYFCAICNNDSISLEFWKPRIECSEAMKSYNVKFENITLNYVYNNLVYENGEWGMYLDTTFSGNPDFQLCEIDPQIPLSVVDIIRKCKCTADFLNYNKCNRPVSTCSPKWNNTSVENLCHSYTAILYDQESIAYRNIHCAMCNNVSTEILQCNERHMGLRLGGIDLTNSWFNPKAFSLLFDFIDFNGSNIVGSVCNTSEIWDPFFKQCRNVICGKENYVYKFGKCVSIGDVSAPINTEISPTETPVTTANTKTTIGEITNVAIIFPSESGPANDTSEGKDDFPVTTSKIMIPGESGHTNKTDEGEVDSEVPTVSPVSDDPKNGTSQNLNCNKIPLPKKHFKMYANGTVYVEKYGKIYQKSEYKIHSDGILVCTITQENGKFSPLMGYVTLAGLSLSCAGILLHLIAFSFVPDLRNLTGKNLASLCIALLAAYATFIIGLFAESGKNECFIIAAVMYYFFLSSFCWMNIMAANMALDIWQNLRMSTSETSEFRLSQRVQWRKFIFYSLYGWLVPLAALFVVVLLDTAQPDGFPTDFLPSFGQRWCWFGQRKALLVFFAAPLAIQMGANFIFFIFSASIIADTHQSPYQNQFKVYMRLALLMGLTWISGIFAGYLQMETIWYVFVLLNTLQGVFIFISFTCRRKVWRVIISGPCCRKNCLQLHSSVWNIRSFSSRKQGLASRNSHDLKLSTYSSTVNLTANTSHNSSVIF